jgi:hypothetical protein
MKEVYTVWAEWSVGVNHCIYSSYEVARENLNAALIEHADMTLEQAEAAGLAGIECHEVVEE